MDWSVFEKEFRPLYCTEGRPALPIRRLVGLMMLKSLRNLSDEEVVVSWIENPYAQDFCGEREKQWGAGRVVRQLDAAVPEESRDRRWVETAKKILSQKRSESGKIYSLHEPEVYCMSKGKEHKKYEFGAKASVVVGKNSGVILGTHSLLKNDYDGHALEATLEQVERVSGYRPAVAIGDKGFRGKTHCGTTEVVTPGRPKKNATAYRETKGQSAISETGSH